MLLNDLFIVDDWQPGPGTLTTSLRVRIPHRILEGHFPNRPVLPGACLVQLVQELAAAVAGNEVRLVRTGQVKFITLIDPVRDGAVRITLTGKELPAGEFQITAVGINAGATCFRFTGIFRGE